MCEEVFGKTKLVVWRAGPFRDWWRYFAMWEASELGYDKVLILWENQGELAEVELSETDFKALLDSSAYTKYVEEEAK